MQSSGPSGTTVGIAVAASAIGVALLAGAAYLVHGAYFKGRGGGEAGPKLQPWPAPAASAVDVTPAYLGAPAAAAQQTMRPVQPAAVVFRV
jgi:hypothetical protein